MFAAALLAVSAAGCAPKAPVDAPPQTVVFFIAQSVELDAEAQSVIRAFAADATSAPRRSVTVRGFADSAGTAGANQMLSALRAKVVADALVAQGIAPGRIRQRPRGSTGIDPGLESRRVELELGS